jgi:hypothetical protein
MTKTAPADHQQSICSAICRVAAYDYFLPATLGGQASQSGCGGRVPLRIFFDVAELSMTLGRGFHGGEDRSPMIVLGYGLGRRHFSGDVGVVGKTVSVSGKMFTVIGVTARRFHEISRLIDAEFWVPLGQRR